MKMADEVELYDILVKKRCICNVSDKKLFVKYLLSMEQVSLIHEENFASNRDFRDSLLVKTSIIRILDQLINGGKPICFEILDSVTKFRSKISPFLTSLLISRDKHLKYAAVNGLLAILRITDDTDILSTFCDSSFDDNDKFDFLIKAQLTFNTKYSDESIDGCQNAISRRKETVNVKKMIDIKLNKLNEWLNSSMALSLMTNDLFLRFWSDTIRMTKKSNSYFKYEKICQINHVESLLSVSCSREKIKLLNEILSTRETSTNFQVRLSDLLLAEIEKGWLNKIKLQIDDQNFFIGGGINEHKTPENNFVHLREAVFLVLAVLNTYSGCDPNVLKANRVSNVQRLLSKSVETWTQFRESNCWLVHIFIEQDDLLITAMLYCTQIYINLKGFSDNSLSNPDLNPHCVFLNFLRAIVMDPEALVDFLSSIETNDILIFFVKYLKLVITEWEEFRNAHDNLNHSIEDDSDNKDCSLDATMTTLIRLRLKLERLEAKKLFPYKIKPLCKLIEQCENLYEQ